MPHPPQSLRRITAIALYTALTAAVGLLLWWLPNVELISVTIFLGGWLFGMRGGAFIGFFGMGLFSVLNFNGSGLAYPPMLVAQTVCAASLALWAGFLQKFETHWLQQRRLFLLGGTGLLYTTFYSITVSLASFIASGFPVEQWPFLLGTGLIASALHIIINTVLFTALLPVFIDRIPRHEDAGRF